MKLTGTLLFALAFVPVLARPKGADLAAWSFTATAKGAKQVHLTLKNISHSKRRAFECGDNRTTWVYLVGPKGKATKLCGTDGSNVVPPVPDADFEPLSYGWSVDQDLDLTPILAKLPKGSTATIRFHYDDSFVNATSKKGGWNLYSEVGAIDSNSLKFVRSGGKWKLTK